MDVSPNEKLVGALELLELIWCEESRPSLRWLRAQTKARSIPFIRIGGRVFFAPSAVMESLQKTNTVREATGRAARLTKSKFTAAAKNAIA